MVKSEENNDQASKKAQQNSLDDENSWSLFSQEDLKVFSLLVPESERFDFEHLSGMIAYAFYTLHKREYILGHLDKEHTLPKDSEIKTIVSSFQNENGYLIEQLRAHSQSILVQEVEAQANQIVQGRFLEPVKEIVKENSENVEKTVRDSTTFKTAVKASICASFIYSFLIAVVIFIATSAMPDTKFSQIIRILFETEQLDTSEQSEG
ncbi:MAG: hypothetical protein F6K00_24725 [Leptolyngbya sp. SIOISBB]|nr:hypothetical protein [Leptolyngbya sp. SIOISBB]